MTTLYKTQEMLSSCFSKSSTWWAPQNQSSISSVDHLLYQMGLSTGYIIHDPLLHRDTITNQVPQAIKPILVYQCTILSETAPAYSLN